MSRTLPCGACGLEGYDAAVAFRIVEIPEGERRQVNVFIPDPSGSDVAVMVEERYVREPRCRDVKACAERVAAFELAALADAPPPPAPDPAIPPPVAAPVEEQPEWRL